MALDRFRAPPLPNPPPSYDSQYIRQLIRALELYFSQLDSNTPNNAKKYTADEFVGGVFSGIVNGSVVSYTTTEKLALTPVAGTIILDSDLDKICFYTGSGWETVTSAP